ncbi:MAG: type II secretion system protein [Lentisphaeria bacterium]|nr:type II secretion system protein [Lentisphaeria bacterium]
MKKFKKSRFTLIELLAVIALLSVLITLFAPAFSRMMVGSKVDQMASNFKTGMEMAQSKAVASGKYVAMILPTKYDDITDPKLKSYCNGGFRLAYVKKEGKDWVFVNWVAGSNWSNIVDGAMLVACERKKNWWNDDKKFKPLSDANPNISTSSAIAGKSNLDEIVAKDSKDVDIKALGTPNSDGKSDNWRGIVFSPLSGFANSDIPMLLFFTEARVNGSAYEYPNTDNFVVLKLNSITGKATYLPMEDGDE